MGTTFARLLIASTGDDGLTQALWTAVRYIVVGVVALAVAVTAVMVVVGLVLAPAARWLVAKTGMGYDAEDPD